MADPDFWIKQHDTRPLFQRTLEESVDGGTLTPIDLATATTVILIMTKGAIAVGGACTVVDPEAGKVQYTWQATDTAAAGDYNAEFEITWADSGKSTVPNDPAKPYLLIRVIPDLG